MTEYISQESVPMTFLRVFGRPYLRVTALRCIASIIRNFFLPQWVAALLPGRIPVSNADHPLDEKIPFLPRKINTYLDFVAFWIRSLSFFLRRYGKRVEEPLREFLESMGGLYAYAAEVYSKHMSTTYRPFYIGRFKFFTIHFLDPHLMCIPSLHVMVVIRTYTFFDKLAKGLVNVNTQGYAIQIEELYKGALDITEAVLYVKQHSVNCIPAALYAMTSYDPGLFPPEEAERFVNDLFADAKKPDSGDIIEIREHILSLYRHFLAEGEIYGQGEDWKKPLFDFLKSLPKS